MKKIDDRVKMFGLHLVSNDSDRLLNEVGAWIENSSKVAYIFTPNPEQVVLAWKQPTYQAILQQGDWLLPDGVGLVWCSQLKSLFTGEKSLHKSLPGRLFAENLVSLAKNQHFQTLLIGGKGYSGSIPADWPLTWIAGYQDISHPTREEEAAVAALIKKIEPAVIFVAFGAPHQEKWLVEHRSLLDKHQVKVGMVVGGAFDVLLGKIKRPPAIWSRLGLEWLYRLIQQPWRWRRQSQLLVFIWLSLKEMIVGSRVKEN